MLKQASVNGQAIRPTICFNSILYFSWLQYHVWTQTQFSQIKGRMILNQTCVYFLCRRQTKCTWHSDGTLGQISSYKWFFHVARCLVAAGATPASWSGTCGNNLKALVCFKCPSSDVHSQSLPQIYFARWIVQMGIMAHNFRQPLLKGKWHK